MRRSGGFSYLETLAATALLGVAVLGSSGLLLQWHRTSERLERRAVAEHALAVEMDAVLARGASRLAEGRSPWTSGADAATGLPQAAGEVVVERFGDEGLRRVLVRFTWADGVAARETLLGGRR